MLAYCLLLCAPGPALAQSQGVTVNPGALDLLQPRPAPRPPAPRPPGTSAPGTSAAGTSANAPPGTARPGQPAPARAPARNGPGSAPANAPANGTGTPSRPAVPAAPQAVAPARPPTVPTVPPAIAAIPPPVQVPVARPPAPPVVPVAADAPGAASSVGGGLRVTFGTDRAELNPTTEAALRTFARGIKANEQATVNVYAYAAGTAEDPSTPRRLSLARALAARAVLIDEGVASTRIYPRALGATGGEADRDRVDLVVGAPAPPAASLPAPPRAP